MLAHISYDEVPIGYTSPEYVVTLMGLNLLPARNPPRIWLITPAYDNRTPPAWTETRGPYHLIT